ncbi:MAG: glycosyltransferase, partial [Pseudonocardia sp.]|nr:glycosyltransferase [Pseudonocardia sp.]
MTVLVIALGTHGDVAPYTGLGKRIQQAGHHVAVATQAPFAELVTGCGLEFRELPGDPQAIMSSPEGRRTQRPGPLAMVRILGLIKAAVREMGEGVLDVTRQGADVVLLSMAAEPLGRPVAGGLGVPTVSTSLV